MKKACLILQATASALVMLVALALTVLEGALLFTADFLLYENTGIAFLQQCLKFLIPVFALALGTATLIRKNPFPVLLGLCLTVSAAVSAPFISNGFGIYFLLVSLLFTASNLLLKHIRA